MDWQPIETAPKDGTQILAWDGFNFDLCEWSAPERRPQDACWWIDNDKGSMHPTHWQPLPPPPTA